MKLITRRRPNSDDVLILFYMHSLIIQKMLRLQSAKAIIG